jgi:uracil permease
VLGISGTTLKFGSFELKGMVLATVAAIVLSLLFAFFEKIKLVSNDEKKSSH